uniref:ATPase AAA-type core domain-containing protein n=1 Tax=viral metagenome TaxID=1070528 RepID=A0A6C0HHN3_9ZZZZ
MPLKMKKFNDKNKRLRKNKPDPESSSSESEEDTIYETASETDSTYTPPKKTKKSKRVIEESSEDDIFEKETESEEDEDEEEEDEEFDRKKFRKTLSKMFPSKYMSKKVSKDNKEKDAEPKSDKKQKQKEKESKELKSPKKNTKKDKKSKKKCQSESESESDQEDVSESVHSDDSESESESGDEDHSKGKNAVNIVFSIRRGGGDEEYDEDYDDYEDEYDEDTEDEECNSEDEETFMKETYEKIEMPKEPEPSPKSKKSKKTKTAPEKSEKEEKPKVDSEEEADVQTEYIELQELRKQLTEKLHKKPNSKILKNAITECKEAIRTLVKTTRSKNTKSYYKLVHKDREKTDEMDYFKKHLSNKEQVSIMKEMKEINNHIHIEKPYRLAILQSSIPAKYKAVAMQKLNILKMMEPGDNEYYKIKNWVDTFMKVPFNVHKSLSVSMTDGVDACHDFMGNAKQILDKCVYGLDDAKMQIMQMVGQWISNPSAMGTAIAIKGPPGTGKTSLVKEGISKILGREFAFIALGGAGDSSFLEGHSYTYEGSSWGKIVQILVDSKCMNPVIYFDELDKISETPRGEEIIGILTHLTDTSQNSEFHDKYFSEISFDLSKCLFIFSYNDESRVNPILKDRMYRIQTKGYEAKDKVIIAKNYMLPKIREQVAFQEGDVIIPDDVIQYIAGSQTLTKGESGVRNLKRCLEIIHTKLNLFRLMKPGDNMFMKEIDLEVKFPFTVSRQLVDKFIKNDEPQNQSFLSMYT